MTDMTKDRGHLNGLAGSLGVRPKCREIATAEELELAEKWMILRDNAYREECANDPENNYQSK